MKHIILILLLAICSLAASAQTPKFFGVPVDGTEAQFIANLKAKGLKIDEWQKMYMFADYNPAPAMKVSKHLGKVYQVMMMWPIDSNTFSDIYDTLLAQLKIDNGNNVRQDSNVPIAAGNHAEYVSLSRGDAYLMMAKDAKSMIYLVTNVYNEPE